MQMAFETTIFRNVQKLILIGFAKNADSAKTMCSDIYPALTYPAWVQEDIFFLSILMVRGEAASMRREAPMRALSNR